MLTLIWKCDQIPQKNSYFNGEKNLFVHAHTQIYIWMACEGSVPEFGCAYQSLVSPRDQSGPSIAHLALEYINGTGLEARRLSYSEKPNFSLYLPLFLLPLWFIPPPLLALSYYLPLLLLPPPLHILPRLKTPLPPPLQKEAFLTVTRTQSCMDRDHIAIQHQIGCVWLCVYVTDIK